MSIFKIETSELDSASETLSQAVTSVSDIADTVSDHNVSLDSDVENGSWDFAGVQSTIVSNLEACSTKIKNIATALDSVSQSHTKLQNSLKFEDPTAKKESATKSGNGGSTGSSGGGGGYSGGSSGGYSGGSYGGYSGGAVGVAATLATAYEKDKKEQKRKVEEVAELKTVDVENHFTKVGYAYPDKENLSEESKEVFDDSNFKYDDEGYAKIGDRYVIAADESVGKVGDVIKFTQKDGTVVEAVIGINTTSDKYKNNINFIVSSDKANDFKSNDLTKNLLENNGKIENCGNYKLLDKKLAEDAASSGTVTSNQSTNNQGDATDTKETVETNTNSESKTSNESTTTVDDKPETIVTPVDNEDNPNNGNAVIGNEDNTTTDVTSDSTSTNSSSEESSLDKTNGSSKESSLDKTNSEGKEV